MSRAASCVAQPRRTFDLVIRGGRVIDPETELDAVRDVGITGGRIAAVSAEPLTGTAAIDARGLVVSPGFIDLHTHVNDAATYRLAAQQGVTTALELEIGAPDVRRSRRAARQGADQLRHVGQPSLGARARVRRRRARRTAIVPASQRGTETVAGDAERQAHAARASSTRSTPARSASAWASSTRRARRARK